MAREYFCAYHSLLQSLEPFGDAERGRLFTAALAYSATGEAPQLNGNERYIWPTIKGMIDRDKEAYNAKCRTNKENGSKANGTDRPRTVPNGTERYPNAQEKEKEKEKDKDKEEIGVSIPNGIDTCTEPQSAAVLTMILNDGSEYPITQEYVNQMASLFPAVDVLQEMRSMAAWCLNNPAKRKTRSGIKRFIGNWLSKCQDKGGQVKNTQAKTNNPFLKMLMEEGSA